MTHRNDPWAGGGVDFGKREFYPPGSRMTASPPPADALREALTEFVVWWDNDYRSDDAESSRRWLYNFAVKASRLAAAPAPGLDVERLHQYLHNEAVFTDTDHGWHFRVCERAVRLAGSTE